MYVCRYNVKTRRYSQLEDLVQDILLIYENCEIYNNPGSYFAKEACRQRNLILKFLKEEMQYIVPTNTTADTTEASERYSLRHLTVVVVYFTLPCIVLNSQHTGTACGAGICLIRHSSHRPILFQLRATRMPLTLAVVAAADVVSTAAELLRLET